MKDLLKKTQKIVVIGGGTGTFVVLSGLKKYCSNLTAIVSMADSGGCNKVIKDELGLLPTSDIRQCFVALASGGNDTEKIMRQLFTYRFCKGNSLKGMTFGNLFMAALADILGSQLLAIQKTAEVLRITGKVIPVSMGKTELVAKYQDSTMIKGEHKIDEPPTTHNGKQKIVDLMLKPPVTATKQALEEIEKSEIIILGPGDIFTSTLPNLIVRGISRQIRESGAKIIYLVNLMTKYGQTYHYTARDCVQEIKKYLGKYPDYVFVNNKPIPQAIRQRYLREENSLPVKDDLGITQEFKTIRANLLSAKVFQKPDADLLKRSLVRHDSAKIAKNILHLLK